MTTKRRGNIARLYRAIERADLATLRRLTVPELKTVWPQSGEEFAGPERCAYRHATYPGGAFTYRVTRVVGDGSSSTAELVAHQDDHEWYVVAVLDFADGRVRRLTEYFCASEAALRETVDANL
jgi:ketosteroid isomerase-like protein